MTFSAFEENKGILGNHSRMILRFENVKFQNQTPNPVSVLQRDFRQKCIQNKLRLETIYRIPETRF